MSLAMFEFFENGNYIHENDIQLVRDYISTNLNSWSANCGYWLRQYHIVSKLNIVCNWRKENSFCALAKKGETICNNELINCFADEKHKSCSCSKS